MISLQLDTVVEDTIMRLPTSKSLSNRALIAASLGGFVERLSGLSDAQDTQMLQLGLKQLTQDHLYTGAGGTTFRFLLALKTMLGLKGQVYGTASFNRRPVNTLVEALRTLGADLVYLEKEGFPPVEVRSFVQKKTPAAVEIDASVSSQFVSALMLIGPYLKGGLKLHLKGTPVSTPYIQMTAHLMAHFGISCQLDQDTIWVPEGDYCPKDYAVEADWSAAAFWVEWLALRKRGTIRLAGLSPHSWQGDSRLLHLASLFGVDTHWENKMLMLSAVPIHRDSMVIDLAGQPDLAPALIVSSAALQLQDTYIGLQTLRIKESNRIEALQVELNKVGAIVHAEKDSVRVIKGLDINKISNTPVFQTYEDHRIAMALAPLALFGEVVIQDPDVVAKSYPAYWQSLRNIGVRITGK